MNQAYHPNLEILLLAVDRLGELADEMVFVGGCATGLLISDTGSPPVRVTRDVDAIVQVFSHSDYYRLSDNLRGKGFSEDMSEGAPLCRWTAQGVILDVMPTDPKILGFGNQWYEHAAKNAHSVELPTGRSIHVVSAPYFLITKLEAFRGRGKGDYLMSHDMEDIVTVLDGRPELSNEVKAADATLAKELSKRFQALLQDERFIESVSGHMPPDAVSQMRVSGILETIKTIAENK